MSSNNTVMSISPSGRYNLVAKEPKYYILAEGYFSKIMPLTLHINTKLQFKDGNTSLMFPFGGPNVVIELNNFVVEP
jgi:hypothetical protein